jgi:hypothetical protein
MGDGGSYQLSIPIVHQQSTIDNRQLAPETVVGIDNQQSTIINRQSHAYAYLLRLSPA